MCIFKSIGLLIIYIKFNFFNFFIFKPALNESEYQYTEFKEIKGQNSVTEIIDDLQPGIAYSFGVVLISEDGNYNNDDIVMVNYSTLCRCIYITWKLSNILYFYNNRRVLPMQF